MELIITYIGLCACVPFWAKKKGHPPLEYFILSLIMTPVIALVIVFFLKKRTPEDTQTTISGDAEKMQNSINKPDDPENVQ